MGVVDDLELPLETSDEAGRLTADRSGTLTDKMVVLETQALCATSALVTDVNERLAHHPRGRRGRW